MDYIDRGWFWGLTLTAIALTVGGIIWAIVEKLGFKPDPYYESNTDPNGPLIVVIFSLWPLAAISFFLLWIGVVYKSGFSESVPRAGLFWLQGFAIWLLCVSIVTVCGVRVYSEKIKRRKREAEETEQLKQIERQRQHKLHAEWEEARTEEERREKELRGLERAKQERREKEAFDQAPKVFRCPTDSLTSPAYGKGVCPSCGGPSELKVVVVEPSGVFHRADFRQEIERLIVIKDLRGIADIALERLTEDGFDAEWTGDARYLQGILLQCIEKQFNLPQGYSYPMPHADLYIPGPLRNQWKTHWHPQLIILCYVLGSHWTTLPGIHLHLTTYYRWLSGRQSQVLQSISAKLAEEKARAKRPFNPFEGAT